MGGEAFLRADDAINTLLLIFIIRGVFFTLPFCHVVLFYDLMARGSIECPSVLVHQHSPKSLLTLYYHLWQRKELYKYMSSSK